MSSWQEWVKFAPKPRPLSEDKKYNVFLSYRSVNRTWVINLYDVLREQGYEVFLDQYNLLAGSSLNRVLGEALEASQSGVLVWSDATRDSDWVKDEYNLMMDMARATGQQFKFVPIKLDESELPQGFIKEYLYLDFSSYPDGPNGGELLKLLYALVGEKPTDEAVKFASRQDEASATDLAKIQAAISNGQARHLQELFKEGGVPWQTSPTLGCKAAEGLTQLDRYDEAIEMLKELETRFPKAIRPKQLHALALARRASNHPDITGEEREKNFDEAQEILGTLYELGEHDPETIGILARTWFDKYKKSNNVIHLRKSRSLYVEAFEAAQDDYYTGINAAAKSVLIGSPADLEKAAEYAERVRRIVGEKAHADDYWKTATVAETFLIQKNYQKAAELYQTAVEMSPEEIGSHKSTWGQAALLMEKLQPSDAERSLIAGAFAHLQ
jgi:tetratricopeptide (TPR) repeat protein